MLNHSKTLSGHPDLNREPPAPKAGALPLEPCPECVYCSNFARLSKRKIRSIPTRKQPKGGPARGFAIAKAQSKTSLRLSSPAAHQAVGALGRKKPALARGFKCSFACLPVKCLTAFSCRPGSRFCPCKSAKQNIAPPFKSGRAPSSWCAWTQKTRACTRV